MVGDEYLKPIEMPPVSVIKIDIEGLEERALKGLKHTMEKNRPLVVVEVVPTAGGHDHHCRTAAACFRRSTSFSGWTMKATRC